MKSPEKIKVSREFKIQPHELENYLKYITAVRNFCAHGNRLFCYSANRKLLNDTRYHESLDIPKLHGQYVYGKNDLFAALIALRILLSHNDYGRLKNKLKKSIHKVSKNIKTLDKNEILATMGFPTNWTFL
jgi:abortive infection bacteriophage resistance protein